MGYLFLAIAIVAEVIATSALKASEGFSDPAPSAVVVLGYGTAFYFLSLVLKTIPVGVAYAIWSGMGIVLITLVAALFFPPAARHGIHSRHGPDNIRGYRYSYIFENRRPLTVHIPRCVRFLAHHR